MWSYLGQNNIWSESHRLVFKFCYQSTSLVQEIYRQNELCILEKNDVQ